MEFSRKSRHSLYTVSTCCRPSLVLKKLLRGYLMLHHKPLHNHSACEVTCVRIGLNLGMQHLMKNVNVSVYCEFALKMPS